MILALAEAAKNINIATDVKRKKMKKLFALIIVSLLLFSACFLTEEEDSGTSGKFWAQDFNDFSFFKVNAQLLAENDLCYVWAEKGSGITKATAQSVADEYQNKIYYKMLITFGYNIGLTDDLGNIIAVKNPIQLINWYAKGKNEDDKLTILLMDIKDNYKEGVNNSYVAGYFWSGNLYEDGDPGLGDQRSNECDMIYIDTNPGLKNEANIGEAYETLAHELQHLMNFAGTVIRKKATDIWIDEGLSVTAEWAYKEEHPAQRLGWYNNNYGLGQIDKGNNFFVWGNHEEDDYAVLDDYSTVYLFFQWLRLQSGNDIFWKVSSSIYYNFFAVIDAFNSVTSGSKYSDWESMLKDWLAANYYKNTTGPYGYGNDTVIKNNLETRYAPANLTPQPTINLYPGEGVYSYVKVSSYPIPSTSANIKYAGLNKSSIISSGSLSKGDTLLTFNANTNYTGNAESGTITGAVPPASSASVILGGRSIGANMKPFPISAGDMLRRKGKNNAVLSGGLGSKIPGSYRGIIVNE